MECFLCLEKFDDEHRPATMRCGHGPYGESCLRAWWITHGRKTCPLRCTDAEIPNDGIIRLYFELPNTPAEMVSKEEFEDLQRTLSDVADECHEANRERLSALKECQDLTHTCSLLRKQLKESDAVHTRALSRLNEKISSQRSRIRVFEEGISRLEADNDLLRSRLRHLCRESGGTSSQGKDGGSRYQPYRRR